MLYLLVFYFFEPLKNSTFVRNIENYGFFDKNQTLSGKYKKGQKIEPEILHILTFDTLNLKV